MYRDIKIQLVEKEIVSNQTHEIKEALDKDYRYMVGIAIADGIGSGRAVIETAKVKGVEFLPEGFEAVNITASKAVQPNRRFFTLFNAVEVSGDDLVVLFRDLGFTNNYVLKIQVLLTNNPQEVKNGFNS